jgi:hypothetical protein
MALATGSACIPAINPRYVFAPGEAKARVFVVDGEELSLFKDQKFYSVKVEKGTRYASIPASGPVELGRSLFYGKAYFGFSKTYSCYPMTAFEPQSGASYVMDVVLINDGCLAQLVREAPGTRTGVRLEPSVRRFLR